MLLWCRVSGNQEKGSKELASSSNIAISNASLLRETRYLQPRRVTSIIHAKTILYRSLMLPKSGLFRRISSQTSSSRNWRKASTLTQLLSCLQTMSFVSWPVEFLVLLAAATKTHKETTETYVQHLFEAIWADSMCTLAWHGRRFETAHNFSRPRVTKTTLSGYFSVSIKFPSRSDEAWVKTFGKKPW